MNNAKSSAIPWFSRFLIEWMQKNGVTQERAGEILGISQSRISKFTAGSQPRDPYELEELVKKMGGDIYRAAPNWKHTENIRSHPDLDEIISNLPNTTLGKNSPKGTPNAHIREEDTEQLDHIPLLGSIDAGTGTATILREPEDGADGMSKIFAKHPNNKFAQGSTFFLEIEGHSMEPAYEPGDWIAVRRLRSSLSPKQLPLRFLGGLVLPDTDSATFKLIEIIKDDDGHILRIIGRPFNAAYQTLAFAPDDRSIQLAYIFVGSIKFGLHT